MDIVITENQILGPQKVLMDITVRGALASNAAVHLSAPNAQAQSGYDEKIRKYGASAAEANYKLVPTGMVFESTGRIHPNVPLLVFRKTKRMSCVIIPVFVTG